MCIYIYTNKHLYMGACRLNCFNHIQLFATLWTGARQAPLSKGFSRQQNWSGLPCPPPAHLPNPGVEVISPTSPALAGIFFIASATWETHLNIDIYTLALLYIFIYNKALNVYNCV